MSSLNDKLQAKIAEAAAQTDYNETVAGGSDRRTPEAGITRLRLISYIETGQWRDEKYDKTKDGVTLQFELSGPKHAPTKLDDGREIPLVVTIRESLSRNEKSNFSRLFKRMNHTGQYTHMAQMLGQDFLGEVVLNTSGEGSAARTYANLRDTAGYTIRPPFASDFDTGESVRVTVAPALNAVKCFLWDHCDKEQWDSIFIDGRWDDKTDDKGNVTQEGRSKNFYQDTIRAATNFQGSPIAELLFSQGATPDLGDAEAPERSEVDVEAGKDKKAGAAADPLEGVA